MMKQLNPKTCEHVAWTGGSTPSKQDKRNPTFRKLRIRFFRQLVRECGGLDLWVCAGTTSLERARIFWKQATLDTWATMRDWHRWN